MPRPKRKYSEDLLKQVVATSSSLAEVCRVLGIALNGATRTHVRGLIQHWGISTSHFLGNRWASGRLVRKVSDILVLTDRPQSILQLRRALLKTGRTYKCEGCQNDGMWLGKDLRLQIDHINGNRRDNRPENLRFLCPNCHTQTETWGYKKKTTKPSVCHCGSIKLKNSRSCRLCSTKFLRAKTKIIWPSVEELGEMIKIKSKRAVARELGVSDVGLANRLRKYGGI